MVHPSRYDTKELVLAGAAEWPSRASTLWAPGDATRGVSRCATRELADDFSIGISWNYNGNITGYSDVDFSSNSDIYVIVVFAEN